MTINEKQFLKLNNKDKAKTLKNIALGIIKYIGKECK